MSCRRNAGENISARPPRFAFPAAERGFPEARRADFCGAHRTAICPCRVCLQLRGTICGPPRQTMKIFSTIHPRWKIESERNENMRHIDQMYFSKRDSTVKKLRRRALYMTRPKDLYAESGQTLQGSLSAVSKPNFARNYALESSRRDLHNALLCTVLSSQFFV